MKSASRSDLSIHRPGLFHVRLSQSAHVPPAGSVARPTQPGHHTGARGGVVFYKRLLGLRGGRKAYDEERRGEQILDVEQAAARP